MFIEKLQKFLKVEMGRKLTCIILFGLMFLAEQAFCADENAETFRATVRGSDSSSVVPALLDILLLAGTFVCFLISVRVKSFLKDGELASGWTLFSLSFVLLFVAQLLSLSVSVGFLNISLGIISSLRLLFVICLASGIYFMKKVLS
ncbi:MAG: hypothetical protein KAX39_03565 [candidate division Zixibacteria bacterium]|nr:hypothetical protein [candidate division Zixibacteria bacterium]